MKKLRFVEAIQIDVDSQHISYRTTLFVQNIEKVFNLATWLIRKLPPQSLCDKDDFIVVGLQKLWEMIERYDPFKYRNTFWNFARSRIFGAMIDEVRRLDFLSESDRKLLTKVHKKIKQLQQKFNRDVGFMEACHALHIKPNLAALLYRLNSVSFVRISKLDEDNTGHTSLAYWLEGEEVSDPHEILSQKDDSLYQDKFLVRLYETLDESERKMVRLHFWEGMSQKKIGLNLGISDSAVCQRLKTILKKLKKRSKEKTFSKS